MEIKAKYTDSGINEVRNYVSSKNSKTPFLLLPVRIETRFMKVERADITFTDSHLVGEILEELHEIEIGLLEHQKRLNGRIQKRLVQSFDQRIEKVSQSLREIDNITKEQKTWIQDAEAAIHTEVRKFSVFLNRPNSITMQKSLRGLSRTLKNLNATAPTKTADLQTFLKEMKRIEEGLAIFSNGKTPFTSKKKKKSLYELVTGRIEETRNFYINATAKVQSILHVEDNLVEKAKKLHRQISSHLVNLGTNIRSLHSDDSWTSFVDAHSSLIKHEYLELIESFEAKGITHLDEMKKLDVVDANKILVQSLATKIAFIKLAKINNTSYGDIKKFRKHLKGKISNLEKLEKKAIGGNESQKRQISRILSEVETRRSNFERKLQLTRGANNSQKFGVRITSSVLNSMAEITKTNPSEIKITDRKKLKEAQENARIISGGFLKIEQELGQNISIGDIQLKKLEETLHEAEVAIRKGYQFTETELKQVKSNFRSLQRKAQQTDYESAQLKRDFQIKTEKIAETIGNLENQIMAAGEKAGIQFIIPKKLKDELWVRIYPDDLFVHTHEKAMTEGEINSAKRYWKIVWAVNNDRELVKGAWRSLTASYGNNRAAWIAKTVGDLKRWKNRHVSRENPSKGMVKSIDLLEAILKNLEKVSAAMKLTELDDEINFSAIQDQMDKALVIYQDLKEKPQLIYFLEKSVSIQQRIHAKLKVIIEIVNNHVASNGDQAIVEKIQKVFQTFEDLHAAFSKIKALRTDQFLEHISDPYRYPNSRVLQPKSESWTKAPHTTLLPKQFVAIGRNKEKFEVIHCGNPLPEELQLGMNPETFQFDDENDNPFQFDEHGNLEVEESMRWMVDFDEAVKKGMGMVIPLSSEQAQNGFDELYVVGLNDQTASKDARELENMIENHHYAATGMEFLKIGTPTNNTEDAKTEYSEQETDADDAFSLEMEAPQFTPSAASNSFDISDGEHLSKMLGVSFEHFQHIKNSGLTQIGNARAIHKSLWHSTMGVYMEDMWDKVFTYDNIERTYQFFTRNVIARGYLPSIRIGSQPYGILPVTSYNKISFSDTFSENKPPTLTEAQLRNPNNNTVQKILQFRYDARLKKLLQKGHGIWTGLRKTEVKHAGNIEKQEDPQAAFMNMLGLNATATEFYFRYGVNINDRTAEDLAGVGVNFTDDEELIYSPQSIIMNFYELFQNGYFMPSFEWDDQTDPSADFWKQITRQNARIKDQVTGSRIFTYRYLNRHSLVAGNWVNETINNEPLPVIGNSKNYIQWLLDPSKHVYHDLFNDNNLKDIFGPGTDEEQPSPSILFLLLRQSMLLSYREAAMNILQKDDFFKEPFRRLLGSKESYLSRNLHQFRTKWTHTLKRINDINEGFYFNYNKIDEKPLFERLTENGKNESISDYIHDWKSLRSNYSGNSAHTPFINRTKEIKNAMEHLADIATEDLEKLLAEHLDVTSYRLDAWISGLANRRLEESRALQKDGLFLGAYAWVENLRPGGIRKEVTSLPDGFTSQDDTVYTDEDNEGYIHAPSINHAISAAILRSGYLANDDAEGDLTNRMAVNLSSARVRKALQLISGLRNGLDLASILGYQFEKGLHERYNEAELDKFIYPLRKKFPLIVPIEVSTEDANQTTSNVVHGLDLLESITEEIENQPDASQESLYDYLSQNDFAKCPAWLKDFVNEHGSENEADRKKELRALIKEIDEMADAFDALGDVAISESVYQIVNGNHVRAAAMLSALGDGKILPAPQIVDTPRTGRVITHKVILNFEDATGAPSNWTLALTARAKAEPALNHWLAARIGDPQDYYCQVVDPATADVFSIQLHELPLQAIDLLFLLSSNTESGNADLLDMISHILRKRENLNAEVLLQVDITGRNNSWPAEAKSFYELDWLLRQLKSIIHDARPIGLSDVHIPQENPDVDNPENYNLADLQIRINQIHGELKQFMDLVKTFISSNPSLVSITSYNTAQQHLVNATTYGITNLMADLKGEQNEEASKVILDRLQKVIDLLEKRYQEANEIKQRAALASSTYQKAQELIKAAKKILGEDFPFMPVFSNTVKNDIKNQVNLSDSESLIRNHNGDFPMEEWLQSIANVRAKLYSLEMLKMHPNNEVDLQPVQFPYFEGDHWLGMPFPENFETKEDRLSLVLLNAQAATAQEKQCGLLIDEWVEIIPSAKETTGVAFQYDQPDATPPQSILLAVSPKPVTASSKWEWDDLVYTLMDTLELAKNRTVEPDQLEQSMLGQVLPAVISEVVPPQVSSIFETDEDEVERNLMGVQVVLDYESNLPKEED